MQMTNRLDDFNASLLEEMMMGEAANEDPKKSADYDRAKMSSKFTFAYQATGLVLLGPQVLGRLPSLRQRPPRREHVNPMRRRVRLRRHGS